MTNQKDTSVLVHALAIESECIGARVRIINRKITRMYDEALRPLGIKFSQMNILTFVIVRGPVQSIRISEGLSIEKSTLSRNLNILEKNGWIDCSSSEVGNVRYVKITRAGGALLMKAAPAWSKVQKKVKALLSEKTVETLAEAESSLREEVS